MKALLKYAALVAVVLATGLVAPVVARAMETPEIAPAAARAAADGPLSTVEDYAYPGAVDILQQHGLKVFTGDGNIRFAAVRPFGEAQCALEQLQVEQWTAEEPFGYYFCFDVHGAEGFLTLEVPGTGGVRGGTQPVDAITTWRGERETYHVRPGLFTPIRPGESSDTPESVLMELRLTGS